MDPNGDADKQPANISPAPAAPAAPAAPTISPAGSPTAATETSVAPPPTPVVPVPSEPAVPAGPVINGVSAIPTADKTKRKRWLLPVVIAVVVLLLVGGYVFGFYLPNTPGNVYKRSLSNTAGGYDKLINYAQLQSQKHYKSYNMDGNFKFTGNGLAADGTVSGQADDKSSSAKIVADVMGQKFTLNERMITVSGQTSPDMYVQVTGIKNMLDNYGLETLDNLDGQWVLIDHTLFDSVAGSTAGGINTKVTSPTSKQVQDALAKVGTVNRKYLFSTNKDTAVLTNNKFLGKSTKDGRQVYGYEVGYNKDHLNAYVVALGKALDSSELNAWVKQASNGKSISDAMDLKSLQSNIDKMKGTETFHMYADAKSKLVSRLEYTGKSGNDPTFFIAQGYTVGSVYPFSFGVNDSSVVNALIGLKLDTKANAFSFDLNVTPGTKTSADERMNAKMHVDVTPSNEAIKVEAPANAEPITDLLNRLGLGGALDGKSTSNGSAAIDSGAFLLTQ